MAGFGIGSAPLDPAKGQLIMQLSLRTQEEHSSDHMMLTRVFNSNIVYLVVRVEQEHNIFSVLNMELNKVVEMIIGVQ